MKNWQRLIIAYLITFAVYNIGGFESTDILLGIVFVMSYVMLAALHDLRQGKTLVAAGDKPRDIDCERAASDKVRKAAVIVAVIWTVLYVIYMGGRINRELDNALFSGVYIVLTVAGLFIVLYYSLSYIFAAISGCHTHSTKQGFRVKAWLLYTCILLLCMLPLFLLNYPGTMTVDSFDQLDQVRGLAPYSDHHPWVHTMIIKALYSVGYGLSGSVYGGIAVYTVFQMMLLAMAVSYAIVSVPEGGVDTDSCVGSSERIRIAMCAAFVLYPYNIAYSITMWKDVLFAAAVLVFTVTIYRMYCGGNNDIALLTISGLGMCLLRHNGLYAYILTMTLILIYEAVTGIRKRKISGAYGQDRRYIYIVMVVLLTLLLTALIRGPIQRANNVEAGDPAHNIPIPLQQIGRVVYDDCRLNADEWELLERINTTQFIREEYTPGGADPMMQWVVFGDEEYLMSHKAEYVRLWFRLGMRYPMEYVRAYIDQTRGYYTTMAPEQTEYYGILPGAAGLEPKPVLGARIRIKINEILSKLYQVLPVYGIFYSMGACLMLLIAGAAIILLRDKGRNTGGSRLLTYLPVLALTLTLLVATPLCADLRYAYPLMLCMPFLICVTLI